MVVTLLIDMILILLLSKILQQLFQLKDFDAIVKMLLLVLFIKGG